MIDGVIINLESALPIFRCRRKNGGRSIEHQLRITSGLSQSNGQCLMLLCCVRKVSLTFVDHTS